MDNIKNYMLPYQGKIDGTPKGSNAARCTRVYEQIKKIAEKMRYPKWEEIRIGMDTFSSSPSAHSSTNIIYIPPMFLLDPSEIPSTFKGLPDNSPLLQNSQFIDSFIYWLNLNLDLSDLTPESLGTFQREQVVLFLKMLEKPDIYEKAKEFVLAHEIAHLYFNHGEEKVSSWNVIGQLRQASRWRNYEKDADIRAVETLCEKEGGIYLFKKFQEHFKHLHHTPQEKVVDKVLSSMLFTSKGDVRFGNSDHPSESERIEYISKVKLPFKLN